MSQSESAVPAEPPPAAPAPHDAFAALRYPAFRNLMGGAFLFTIGIQIQEVVIGYELYTMTHRPIVLGLIGLAEAIPFISLALFGGLLADRRDKRKLILGSVSFVVAGSATLLWALLPATRQWMSQTVLLGVIYGVIAAFGLARGLFAPAASAMSAFLVPREIYSNSSAWRSTAWQAGAILGPVSAGFLYAAFGLAATLGLVVGLFIAALALFSGTPPQPPRPIAAGEVPANLWQSLREGIDFVLGNRIIWYALSLDMFSVLFGGVVAILPVFAADILQVGPQGLGVLRAAPSVGAMLTLLACTRYPPTTHAWRNLLIAVAGFGVMTLIFGLSRIFWLSAAALFVSGAFDSISVVIRNTILQVLPPDHLRGRVLSVNSIFITSSNELGAFQAGASASIFGATRSVLIGGTLTLLIVGTIWRRSTDLFKVRLN
ncbi:MAG: transporter [Nevskia sp.]|nr:transporter [Nevskia sp.]